MFKTIIPSKTQIAFYILWIFLHISFLIMGQKYYNAMRELAYSEYESQGGVFASAFFNYTDDTNCRLEFFPFNIFYKTYCNCQGKARFIAAYDTSEFIIYLGIPLVLFLFFLLIRNNKK